MFSAAVCVTMTELHQRLSSSGVFVIFLTSLWSCTVLAEVPVNGFILSLVRAPCSLSAAPFSTQLALFHLQLIFLLMEVLIRPKPSRRPLRGLFLPSQSVNCSCNGSLRCLVSAPPCSSVTKVHPFFPLSLSALL